MTKNNFKKYVLCLRKHDDFIVLKLPGSLFCQGKRIVLSKSRIEAYGYWLGHEIIMKNKEIMCQIEMVHINIPTPISIPNMSGTITFDPDIPKI